MNNLAMHPIKGPNYLSELRGKILRALLYSENEHQSLHEIQDLIDHYGEDGYSMLIHVLTNQEHAPEPAKRLLDRVIKHQSELASRMQRPVSLVTALSDFFSVYQPEETHCLKLSGIGEFEHLVQTSIQDSLTGLFNRNFLQTYLEQQIALAKRSNNEVSLMFLDIDNFKEINDQFGHHAGDLVLALVSQVLKKQIRGSDCAVRYGGEEFIIVLPNTGVKDAAILAERIQNKLRTLETDYQGSDIAVTMSIGLASFPGDSSNAEELVNHADSALYQAKGAGKDCISLYRKDNRRFLRVELKEPVKLRTLDNADLEELSGISKDICMGGILFEQEREFDLGTPIQVSILFEQEMPLILIGKVVRQVRRGQNKFDIGLALSFKEMEKLATNRISSFLNHQQWQGSPSATP